MSPPTTLKGSPSVISLQEFWDGPAPFDWQDGEMPKYGQAVAPANLSPRQAKERGLLTSATFGQHSSGSSTSVDLQSSLASRLRANLDVNGSPEYVLTWKEWPMKWGPPIYALRASAHRTSDNGCTGWPTARANDGTGDKAPPGRTGGPSLKLVAGWATPDANAMNLGEGLETWDARQEKNKAKHKNGNGAGMPIAMQAQTVLTSGATLSGWCSPTAQDGSRGSLPPRPQDTGVPLSQQVALSGWPTTTTRDHKDGDGQSCANVPSNCLLGRVVHLTVGWATPRASDPKCGHTYTEKCEGKDLPKDVNLVIGPITNSSPAETAKRGALNPALSRWLMGYPVEWCIAALQAFRKLKQQAKRGSPGSKGMATRSVPRLRQSSSSPPKKPATT